MNSQDYPDPPEWADDTPPAPPRRGKITWASDIEPEPVVWAWEDNGQGRIASGTLSIAAGREGTGKSSYGIWTVAQITRGTLPGSLFGMPRTALYVAVEDSWKFTLVPRLIAAGADLTKVGRFDVITDEDTECVLSLPADNALLEAEVTRYGVALVVIDPLMSVISNKVDTHREREVRTALDPLAALADRTGAVLLGIAHFNKGASTDAASLITGSGAFKNVPRSVFGFARDEDDENGGRVLTQVKNSLGRDDLPSLSYIMEEAKVPTPKGVAVTARFVFTGESDKSVRDILGDRSDPEEKADRENATKWIVDYLTDSGGEAPVKDIKAAGKAAGFAERTLERARSRCRPGVESVRDGFGKGAVYLWRLVTERDTGSTCSPHARHARQDSDGGEHGEHGGEHGGEHSTADTKSDGTGSAAHTPADSPTGSCTRCGKPAHDSFVDPSLTRCTECRQADDERIRANRKASGDASACQDCGGLLLLLAEGIVCEHCGGVATTGQTVDPQQPDHGPNYCPTCARDISPGDFTACAKCSTGRAHRFGATGHGTLCPACQAPTKGTAA